MEATIASVGTGPLDQETGMPYVISAGRATGLDAWAREHRASIDELLRNHGAILFRGFAVDSAATFRQAAAELCGGLLDYTYRSTPRTGVGDHVYTATEYRADATIPMHNENAYQRKWPMRLAFCCLVPAATGGETPLASSIRVTRRIAPEVKRMFAERGVMYVRNYGHGVDLSWETTFQTDSRDAVEDYCRREDIECEWLSEGRLRTRQVCQAMAQHPATGESLWFNQAHLFHVSSLGPDQKAVMLELFGEQDLPRHAYFGDGGAIDESVLQHIRDAYEAERVVFPWQAGDVVLVDNMLVSHGRNPFTGARQVLVAMGDAVGGSTDRRGSAQA